MSYAGIPQARVCRHFFPLAIAMVIALSGLSLPSSAQNVTVRVTILEVKNLSVGDGLDEVDWYATVTIAGDEMDNEEEANEDEGNDHLFPDWEFSKSIPLSDGSVDVNIEIRDEDDFLKAGDDLADINPFEGRASIDVAVELAPCRFVAPRLVSVDGMSGPEEPRNIAGLCRAGFETFSNHEPDDGDGRALIRFKIEVLDTSGLLVRCTHTPLWPQPGDAVTLKVEALDKNVNLRTADTLELLRDGLADNTTSNKSSHALTYTPAGDAFVYGCRAIAGGDTVFSDWRRVMVGNPPAGERAVRVLYNDAAGNQGVDILLVPDEQDYPGKAGDPQFLEHAASVIYDALGGFYSEPIFLERQHQLNFYLAMDSGDAMAYDGATNTCPHVPPANFGTAYSFAEAAGIIHTGSLRNCANRGLKLFSGKAPMLLSGPARRVIIHEAGHQPFGLADEYCNTRTGSLGNKCDGGYNVATSFFPNVFNPNSPVSCQQDATNETLDPNKCETWMDSKNNGPFSTYDPVRNDLMSDKGGARFLDRRRINGVFDNCPMGGC